MTTIRRYEVFLKPDGKDPFEHVGALEAPDDDLALTYARECYGRRSEGVAMWVVAAVHLLVADPVDLAVPGARTHNRNDGKQLAARRRAMRGG